ncbi:MAG: 8-oxo-dGTP diphosphatase, partial [Terrimicrobiaceae bacterium]
SAASSPEVSFASFRNRFPPGWSLHSSPVEIDWTTWQPKELATLLFIVREERILLIRKKRGLGAGKINGPGGRIEPGETSLEAAVRETREELGIEALSPKLRGELCFQFVDGYSLHCSVFVSADFLGEPVETSEAVPLWTPLNAIPYEEMWADDVWWLPQVLAGEKVRGFFHFEREILLGYRVLVENG